MHGARSYALRGEQCNENSVERQGRKRGRERDGEAGPARMNEREREGGGENFDTEGQRTGL